MFEGSRNEENMYQNMEQRVFILYCIPEKLTQEVESLTKQTMCLIILRIIFLRGLIICLCVSIVQFKPAELMLGWIITAKLMLLQLATLGTLSTEECQTSCGEET